MFDFFLGYEFATSFGCRSVKFFEDDDGPSELMAPLSLHIDSIHTNKTFNVTDTAGW